MSSSNSVRAQTPKAAVEGKEVTTETTIQETKATAAEAETEEGAGTTIGATTTTTETTTAGPAHPTGHPLSRGPSQSWECGRPDSQTATKICST